MFKTRYRYKECTFNDRWILEYREWWWFGWYHLCTFTNKPDLMNFLYDRTSRWIYYNKEV